MKFFRTSSIKIFGCLMFLGLLSGLPATHARIYVHEENWTVVAPVDSLKNLLLDLTNQCSQGCRYYVPSISQTKIVEKENDHHFFIWTYVNSTRDSYFFQEITVTQNPNQQTVVEFKIPSLAKQNELRVKYNLGISSFFDSITSTYTFTTVLDENGKFKNTKIHYTNKMNTNSWLVNSFSSTVYSSMSASAQAMKNILLQAQ